MKHTELFKLGLIFVIFTQAPAWAMHKSAQWVPYNPANDTKGQDTTGQRFGGHWNASGGLTSAGTKSGGSANGGAPIPNSPAPIPAAAARWGSAPIATVRYIQVQPLLLSTDTKSAFRESTDKLKQACKESIAKMVHEGKSGRSNLEDALKKKIADTAGALDKSKALKLQLSIDSLGKASEAQVAEVFCSMEKLTDSIQDFNTSKLCTNEPSCTVKELAKDSLNVSTDELAEAAFSLTKSPAEFPGRMEIQSSARDLGIELLKLATDLATSVVPGISTGRDLYETVVGKDLLDGHELTINERTISALCVASLGAGHTLQGPLKAVKKIGELVKENHVIERVERGFERSVRAAERIVYTAEKHGIEIVTGPTATKVDKVIIETLEGRGNIASKFKLTTNEALDAGKKWVGEGYIERQTGNGVFVSRDGNRQFRIDNGSIIGAHAPNVPHVHLEEIIPTTGKFKTNNHIPFDN